MKNTFDVTTGLAPDVERLIEPARVMFAGPCDFVAGAEKIEALPPFDLPEIAFAGRSNVGKSSLINALTGRQSLVRTSSSPGHTKQVNFFNLADKMHLVDMPGYGFAHAGKERIANWNELIHQYLRGRPTLKRVCLLIDARRGFMDSDIAVMKVLDKSAVSYLVTLTKADEVKKAALDELCATMLETLKKHPAALSFMVKTSSKSGEGMAYLRALLMSYLD